MELLKDILLILFGAYVVYRLNKDHEERMADRERAHAEKMAKQRQKHDKQTTKEQQEYEKKRHKEKLQHELSMASLDKRLTIHQEAYRHCHSLLYNLHKEELSKIIEEAQQWFHCNNVFLTEDVRENFYRATIDAAMLEYADNSEEKRRIFHAILDTSKLILDTTALPGWSKKEPSYMADTIKKLQPKG